VFTGCFCPEPPEPRIITKTETITVKVPVKCESIKRPKCEFSGDGFTPTTKLMTCLVDQAVFIKACTKKIDDKSKDILTSNP
jgi:hypothetical protein